MLNFSALTCSWLSAEWKVPLTISICLLIISLPLLLGPKDFLHILFLLL
jgi:hypothetical protein